jgi:Ca-activated chloride channel family protein
MKGLVGFAAATAVTVALGGAGYAWFEKSRTGCEGEPVATTVAASPDQFGVMTDLANRWTDQEHDVDGRCVAVSVVSAEPSAIAAALGSEWNAGRDRPRPDVWAPDSSVWTVIAAARGEAAALLPQAAPSIATSAIVLALPQPMAEALGWPDKEIGAGDLLGALAAGRTWAQLGHPEWGAMRFGMTDPTRSTAALSMLLAVIDRDRDGVVSDAELTAGVGFAGAVTRTARDTTALVDGFSKGRTPEQALASAVAFPIDEHELVVRGPSRAGVDLVPIYPGEETTVADHPYVILDAPWVDSVKTETATRFRDYLLGDEAREAYGTAGFRDPEGSARKAPNLATELGFKAAIRPVPSRPDAAAVNQIIAQWSVLQRPINVLIVLDTSGSMNDPVPQVNMTRLQLLQQAAVKGIGLLNSSSRMSLWQFSSKLTPTADYQELVPFVRTTSNTAPGDQRGALIQAIKGLRAKGGTGLYDTVYAAHRTIQEAWQPGAINLVIVISDGKNEDDVGLSLDELLPRLQRERRADRPAPILGMAVGPAADGAALMKISGATGGRTFVTKNDTDALQQIVLAFAGRLR